MDGPRLDPATIREVAAAFAAYVDSERQAPMHDALADLVAEPMAPGQLLNCVVGVSNVVALLVLTHAQEESAAAELTRGLVARSAGASAPDVFAGPGAEQLHADAQAFICRAFGEADDLPSEVDGRLLVALAAYGDAAVVLADRVGIPRSVLGPALTDAAGAM